MPKLPLIYFCLFIAANTAWADSTGTPTPDARPKGYDANGGQGKRLYEVPIEGTIELGLAAFVERVLKEAEPDDLVVLRIKTFGGRVDAAVRIRDAVLASPATTIAYVDRRAISAGALITLACDTIVMSEGATIGAATPVQGGGATGEMKATSEKVVSYMRAEMRATAEATNRRADIAEAMVDADLEVEGVSEKGKLLTLTSTKALEFKIADAVTPSLEDALKWLNVSGAKRVKAETHWAEKVTRVLTDPTISSLLMSFGFAGLLMELYTPGFGVGGAIGVTCLGLFFLGQYAANLAGFEEAILLLAGLVFVALEIFVLPGFGIAGLLGALLLLAGFVMGMVEFGIPFDVAFELGYAQESFSLVAIRLAVVSVALIIAAVFLMNRLPKMKAARWMILDKSTSDEEGFVSTPPRFEGLLGKQGRTRCDLRPSGIAEIDGERFDVQTAGDFVSEGVLVEVVEVDGTRLLVKQIQED